MYLVSWCSYPCQKGGPAAFAKKVAFLYSVDLTYKDPCEVCKMKHLGEGGAEPPELKCFFCEKIIWGHVQMMFYLSIYIFKYIYMYVFNMNMLY